MVCPISRAMVVSGTPANNSTSASAVSFCRSSKLYCMALARSAMPIAVDKVTQKYVYRIIFYPLRMSRLVLVPTLHLPVDWKMKYPFQSIAALLVRRLGK